MEVQTEQTQIFKADNLLIIGGRDGFRSESSDVELIDIEAEDEKCSPLDLDHPIQSHSSVVSSLGVITCGGRSNGTRLNRCILQTKEGEIKLFPSMIRPRSGFGMGVMDQNLIVVGGYGAENKMERINLMSDQWVEEDLPFSVSDNCVVSINDTTVMSIGGKTIKDEQLTVSKMF